MTKKTFLKYGIIAIVIIGVLVGIKFLIPFAIDSSNNKYYGVYLSGTGASIVINDEGLFLNYLNGNELTTEKYYNPKFKKGFISYGDNADKLYRYENGEVLVAGAPCTLFNIKRELPTRDGSFRGSWIWGNQGTTLVSYDFFTTQTCIKYNGATQTCYGGTYTLFDGLLTISYEDNSMEYHYIDSDFNLFWCSVFVRNADKIIDDDSLYSDDGIVFEAIEGGYSVINYTGNATHLRIPTYHEGLPVLEIADGAFNCSGNNTYAKNIKSIYLPNLLEKIEMHSFRACSSLESLVLPNSTASCHYYSFESCYNLKSVVLGKSLNFIDDFAFSNCFSLTEIYNISQLVLPQPTEIEELAYKWHTGGGILENAEVVYSSLATPSKIEVVSDSYVVFNNNATKCLIRYIGASEDVRIPEGITKINSFALLSTYDIKSITIPASVTVIEPFAFGSGYSFATFSLTSVKEISFANAYTLDWLMADHNFGCGLNHWLANDSSIKNGVKKDLTSPTQNAILLTSLNNVDYAWLAVEK